MNAGIINAVKSRLFNSAVAVDGDNNDLLIAEVNTDDIEETISEIEGGFEGGFEIVSDKPNHLSFRLLRQPDAYDIVENIGDIMRIELAKDFTTFDEASGALSKVRRRKQVRDPKNVVVLAVWNHRNGTAVEPEVIEVEEIEEEQDPEVLAVFNELGLVAPAESPEAEIQAVDEPLDSGWVTFAAAANQLGVRYQQVYQRAILRNRMRYIIRSRADSTDKTQYLVHVNDIQIWAIERAERLERAQGRIDTAPVVE
jgi:hypothetical protein